MRLLDPSLLRFKDGGGARIQDPSLLRGEDGGHRSGAGGRGSDGCCPEVAVAAASASGGGAPRMGLVGPGWAWRAPHRVLFFFYFFSFLLMEADTNLPPKMLHE